MYCKWLHQLLTMQIYGLYLGICTQRSQLRLRLHKLIIYGLWNMLLNSVVSSFDAPPPANCLCLCLYPTHYSMPVKFTVCSYNRHHYHHHIVCSVCEFCDLELWQRLQSSPLCVYLIEMITKYGLLFSFLSVPITILCTRT